jgi:hypothetical protein
MKPQDKALANIAEAAKRVMKKETEVQPSDKDFVDLHSIDKDKRRGSTPLEEKDVDEANEFTKAAAKAAVAGDDEFEFDGKKFPTEMDVDVAKKILGESADLDEASVKVNGKKLSIEKPKKKGGEYKVTYGKETWHVNQDGDGSTPSKYFDSEVEDALFDLLSESADLEEAYPEFVSSYDKKLEKATTTKDVIKLYPKAKFSNRSLWPGNAAEKPGGVVALEKNLAARFYFKDTEHPGKKLDSNDKFTITAIWSFKRPHVPTSLFGSYDESADLEEDNG